jgi:glutamyl-tRNA synthetase
MKKTVRTRIAPSPTGFATCGNLRTALFNYLFAKKHGGEFVIRIEDTDSSRFVDGAEKYIIDALTWLGIRPDVGIKADGTAEFRQSEREYRSYADLLIAKGAAYYAFDTADDLAKMKAIADASGARTGYNFISRMRMKNSFTMSEDEVRASLDAGVPYVIRFNVPRNTSVGYKDYVKGTIVFDSNFLDDKVLFKSDGMVAYHLANVVDDHLMEITHVIRGDEWVSSTPLHVMLYEAFGWDKPEFCHMPLVLGPDKKKLSKRRMKEYGFTVFPLACSYVDDKGNTVSVDGFKELGYEPDALVNYLALLGWNPGDNKEIMSMDELISAFSLDRVNNSGAIFDIVKLNSFNSTYMRSRDKALLWNKYIWPSLTRHDNYNHDMINDIVDIAKERCVFSKDLYASVSYFFEPLILKDDVVLKNPSIFVDVMNCMLDVIDDSYDFTAEKIKYDLEEFCNVLGIKVGKVLPDLRMALTGGIPGPHLPETMVILGKDESIKRITNLISKIKVAG